MADNLALKSTGLHGPVVLVDGSSYLFRAFYALQDLRSTSGHPTGAVRGVISMLRRLAKDYSNSPLAVVFDAPGKTFRDDMFEEYKANRSAMPDDLREQIAPIHEMIKAMGLPLISVSGVEADDVIGTYAAQATALQREMVISTGDKNMAQLVTPFVTLVNTMTETKMDADGVKQKFGVGPELIIDYLALIGDTVDNIPGVPKVGPKTAAKWLNEFGSLDELMSRADEVKGKVGENLRDSLEQLPLSRALTTIKCDVALDLTFADLVPTEPDTAALSKFYKEFEFKSYLQELDSSAAVGPIETTENEVPAQPAVETEGTAFELSRNQLLIGSVGLTFLPVLVVYDFFSGIRASDHFFIFSIAIILWMLGMFFSIFRFALSGTAEDPLTRYFDNASSLNICGVGAGFAITLVYQILERLGGF